MTTEEATQIECALERYAAYEPPFVCWLGGDEANASDSYCRPCAEAAVAEGKGEFVDGDWGYSEADYCEHCETCGATLAYTLTACGTEREIDHYARNPPSAPLSKDDAFHIARMVAGAPDNEAALRIARAAVALIPPAAPAQPQQGEEG